MNYVECLRALARQRTDQVVITRRETPARPGGRLRATPRRASISMLPWASRPCSRPGSRSAQPSLRIWAFMGDGAFCMNPGMLMVERQMNLPNLIHFVVSNRVYGATSNAVLPNFADNDYAGMARSWGLDRVFEFRSIESIEREFAPIRPRTRRVTPLSCSRSSPSRTRSRSSSSRHSTGRS